MLGDHCDTVCLGGVAICNDCGVIASVAEPGCPYCRLQAPGHPEPVGGWIAADEYYVVQHGEPESSSPGAVKIISRRHFIDFADMSQAEAHTFGSLVSRLDRALRETTDAERVHLVSTRDRIPHFHAWLYPRAESSPLRGTTFLAAPQQGSQPEAEAAAQAVRAALASE
jgi:diadenosine tetraphosphate (Ap4A) HIT family hydrolase